MGAAEPVVSFLGCLLEAKGLASRVQAGDAEQTFTMRE